MEKSAGVLKHHACQQLKEKCDLKMSERIDLSCAGALEWCGKWKV